MRKMDTGTAIGLQASALGIGTAALLYRAHAEGMRRVQAGREARAEAAHDAYVMLALSTAQNDLAKANREIARLKAEVERLELWHTLLTAPLPKKKAA